MPTKLIVTDVSRMKKKYKTAWPSVQRAVTRLIKKDAARGITTTFVALDDAALGQNRARSGRRETYKEAIDHLWGEHHQPDYILLLGGPDVLPHQSLRNPVPDDGDADVPSDLPYACQAPASDEPAQFIAPSRVVGRLPDLPKSRSPKLLIGLLDAAAGWKPKTKADYRGFFGISAHVWRRSTAKSLKALFGAAAVAKTSPQDGPQWTKGDLAARTHFINCHGGTVDPQFYGQKGQDYPVAHLATHLPGKVAAGTLVAAECCYGAELYEPNGVPQGICIEYLRGGAIGFVGSTNTAYGPSTANGEADLVCRYFLAHCLEGASLGRAMLEARLDFVQAESPLNPAEVKTLAQFLLLGDPSLRAVADTTPKGGSKGKRSAPALARAALDHIDRRAALNARAATLGKGVDTVADTPVGTPPPRVRAALANAAREEGFLPGAAARTYAVRPGADPVSRSLVAPKAAPTSAAPVRYHMMMAKRPSGAAAANGAKGRAAAKRPRSLRDELLLLAREVGGKVMEIERLYSKRAAEIMSAESDRYEGLVVRKRKARGSKSDHGAVVLETADRDLVLRLQGGNAFRDPRLDELVGRRIRGAGRLSGSTLILTAWEELEA